MADDIESPVGLTRLEQLEKRILQLKHEKQRLENRYHYLESKARTRHLIQIGALSLKYLNCDFSIDPREFEKVLKKALGIPQDGHPL